MAMRAGVSAGCWLVSLLSIGVAALVSAEGGALTAPGEQPPSSLDGRVPGTSEPPEQAIVGVIDFEPETLDTQTRILLNIAPDGRAPFIMTLDTGSSSSIITPQLARSMGVMVRRDKVSPYRRRTRLGRELLFYIDHDAGDGDSGQNLEYAFLGANFLKHYVVELDYPGRRVRFIDPQRFAVPDEAAGPDERVIDFQLSGDRVMVEIEIHGRSVSTLLDTGVPGPVLLSGTAAGRVGISSQELREFQELQLTVGTTQGKITELDDLRLAGFEFEMTPILVAPQGLFGEAGPMGSLLGYDILRHFVIRIDYPNQRIWLRRVRDLPMTLYGFDYAQARERYSFDAPADTPEPAHGRGAKSELAEPVRGRAEDGDATQ